MNNEIWYPAEGFTGVYEVSNMLRVRSVARELGTKTNWFKRKIPQKIMKTRKLKDGTAFIKLGGKYFNVVDLLPG
jgi:hypothetical protein